jgi:hypothetical protein
MVAVRSFRHSVATDVGPTIRHQPPAAAFGGGSASLRWVRLLCKLLQFNQDQFKRLASGVFRQMFLFVGPQSLPRFHVEHVTLAVG